ncbi:AAA family ATPase [Candidatus Wolfebacteria bacterium]|nr:AAA family ATPase [Candidatus Wolfebacteria bacterium]
MTQQEALNILKTGVSVFLTGAAGSGKTYLLNEYIQFLKEKGINAGITASTGIAATHIGGLTIHSWAGIGINRKLSDVDIRMIAANRRIAKRFAHTEALIIDEISMLDADRLDLVERVARAARGSWQPFGGMQVVICGDFFQLPPVARENEPPPRFAYHSLAWKELNLKICYLREQYRHNDKKFFNILNAIRRDKVDDAVISGLESRRDKVFANDNITKLYSHNIDVDAENFRELGRLREKEFYYQMEESGVPAILKSLKSGCLAPEILTIKKEAKVMFIKNNFEKGYVNGTLGRVVDFDDGGYPIVVVLNGRKIIASPEKWSVEENGKILAKISQVPLRLAWAITIHKSQGMTLDAAEINLEDAFKKGMGYVALSRVRSLSGIKLIGFNKMALEVHPEILVHDRELQWLSDMAISEFNSAPKNLKKFGWRENKEKTKTYSVNEIRKSHSSAYQKWSPEEEKELVADFKKGESIKTIANNLGRKNGAVRSRLKKLGF